MTPYFISTAIPYVNAKPHIGFAMELVLADVLARYARQRGRDVLFQTGTDDNSLKNVRAAQAEGIDTETLVERNTGAFRDLREPLGLEWDDFIQTSTQARHREGVQRLWRACDASGDIYHRPYRGLYCVGCEQFYAQIDLVDGCCPEHGTAPELVEEENYFFRLSRYQAQIERLISSGELRIEPEQYRRETLAFVRSGLEDFSISRSQSRAHGWGIHVPDDPEQVMYVWFDALGNYVTGPGYAREEAPYQRYWINATQRVHVIGKGVTRFHAVYWPAMLLSARLPLPTAVAVHGYLTVDGEKISKSRGNSVDPLAAARASGTDALRYYLCRHFRFGQDGDFSAAKLQHVRNTELADQLGNLLQRTIAMISRYYGGTIPAPEHDEVDRVLPAIAARLPAQFGAAFESFRPDEALRRAWELVAAANVYVVNRAPWKLAKQRSEPAVERKLATTLYDLTETLRLCAVYLEPFTPATAQRIREQIGVDAPGEWAVATRWGELKPGGSVKPGATLFPKSA